MRIAVTGRQGQVARALAEAGPVLNAEVINLGRPQLDLAVPETVGPALKAATPDIVVNTAA
jgi:dTDP-4-dehydrorhamnose reductase